MLQKELKGNRKLHIMLKRSPYSPERMKAKASSFLQPYDLQLICSFGYFQLIRKETPQVVHTLHKPKWREKLDRSCNEGIEQVNLKISAVCLHLWVNQIEALMKLHYIEDGFCNYHN